MEELPEEAAPDKIIGHLPGRGGVRPFGEGREVMKAYDVRY